ncbi:MAG TPA: hypothetical protein VKX24_05875 [Acidimicrobiia bacterium]|nr:hypothetical protein [Acidimicrobiia bacterium]
MGSGTCPGVRPGGRVVTTIGDCTLNFLFRAPDGTRYIGTAGHCVNLGTEHTFKDSDSSGNGHIEKIWARGTGPVAKDPTGQRIGEFVYAVVHDPKDFALIRLDPGVKASPEMCYFGAPRGLFTSDTDDALVLRYYGNGTAVGAAKVGVEPSVGRPPGIDDGGVAPARSAVAMGTPDPDHVYAAGVALPGDSGAGVMTADGQALGVLVTAGVHGIRFAGGPDSIPAPSHLPRADDKGVDVGTMGITRLGPQLARASEELGVPLELVVETRGRPARRSGV